MPAPVAQLPIISNSLSLREKKVRRHETKNSSSVRLLASVKEVQYARIRLFSQFFSMLISESSFGIR